ncbi:hypothetical protein B0H19DRAFT_1084013 [Mycena capillaripes]|nr:hypothetical protein B0H19DRAFT_1084013 [Mycena capillaripes]
MDSHPESIQICGKAKEEKAKRESRSRRSGEKAPRLPAREIGSQRNIRRGRPKLWVNANVLDVPCNEEAVLDSAEVNFGGFAGDVNDGLGALSVVDIVALWSTARMARLGGAGRQKLTHTSPTMSFPYKPQATSGENVMAWQPPHHVGSIV